jgi:hypothetical protein
MSILDDAANQQATSQPAAATAAPSQGSILDQAAAAQPAAVQTPPPQVESMTDRWKREAYETIGKAVPQAAVAPLQGLQTHVLDKFHQSSSELGKIAESKVNTALAYGMDSMDSLQSDLFNEDKQPGLGERAGIKAGDPLASNKMRTQFEKENPWIAGATGGVANLAGQVLGDPTNWPFLAKGLMKSVGTVSEAALKPWAEKLMSKGFGLQMSAGVVSQLDELKDNWSKMSDYDKSHAISQVIAGTYMTQSAVREGFRGEPKAETPTTITPAQGGEGPRDSAQTGTEQGEATSLRPTTRTTAGVEAPVTAKTAATLEGQTPSILNRAAEAMAGVGNANEFGHDQTAPAATRQAVSTVGQVAEDRIAQHTAIVNGEDAAEPITGTQQASKFVGPDEAWQEMQKTAQDTTFRKADDISQREQKEWEAKRDEAIREYKELVDRHNKNIDDYNAQVPKEQRMPQAVMNPAEVAVPERPQSYNELRSDVQTAQANAKSQDAAVREEAIKNDLPKAEKAIDGWFKEHADEVSPAEYDSVKKLWSDSERMKEIAMGLRGPLTKGNLTGNQMRQIEVSMNNRQLRRGQSPDAFQRLLGPDGYNNWQNVAKLFDTVKDPTLPEMFKSWGSYAAEYTIAALIPHLSGVGIAVKWGMEKLLNHVMFDPEFGETFSHVADWLKEQKGRVVDSITEFPANLRDKLVGIIKSYQDAGEQGAVGRNIKKPVKRLGENPWTEMADKSNATWMSKLHNEKGGFTFNSKYGDMAGKSLFSVAGEPEVQDLKTTITGKNVTPQDIEAFASRPEVKQALQADRDRSIGGWINEKGDTELEVSKVFKDQGEAEQAAKDWNQQSIWDHKDGQTIPTGGTGKYAGEAAPVASAQTFQAHHWSNTPDLTETDPEKMGTGVRGAERARSNEPGFQKRTNFGTEGYKEPAVQGQKYQYVSDLQASKYYDAQQDSDGIWQKGFQEGGATGAEKAIRDAGYHGYRVGNEVASFEKVPVREFEPPAPPRVEPPQPQYIDRKNGMHEVITGPAKDRLAQILAQDVPSEKEGEPSTEVRASVQWVSPEQRRKGLGTAQLETLAHSLADSGKTALLSDTSMTDGAKGSWKKLMANYPLAVTETPEGYRFDLEKLKAPSTTKTTTEVKGSTVQLMKNPLPVKTVGSDTPSTVDVAKALNKYTKRNLGALQPGSESAEMVARATELAEDEARYQMSQNNSGATWYTEQMAEHDAVAKEMRPALTDDTKLSLFKFAEAILSSGQKPYRNFTATMEAWDHYAKDGKFPINNPATDKSWGPRGVAAYGNALEAVNRLVEERGEKGAVDWMMSEHPVSELKLYNKNVAGKKTDLMHGVSILGAKRGPFAQNLHGMETAFTADMWVSRTWNRWMGSIETDPKTGEVTSDAPRNQQERALMKQSFAETGASMGLTTSALQAVLWYYEQALYTAHGTPKESWSFSDAARRAQSEEKAKVSAPAEPVAPPAGFGPRAREGQYKDEATEFNPKDMK